MNQESPAFRHGELSNCGSIYNARDQIVDNPSILIDGENDVFLGWGNAEAMYKKMKASSSLFTALKVESPLTVVELSPLPKDVACYILRRMMEYPASGFISQFLEHRDDPNALEWLASEMQRVPIALEQ